MSKQLAELNSKNETLSVVSSSNPTKNKLKIAMGLSWPKRKALSFLMKAKVIKYLPLAIRNPLLTENYAYDLARFLENSAIGKGGDKKRHLWAKITMEYHAIEKGISLQPPKPLFGIKRIEKLLNLISEYYKLYGSEEITQIASNTLLEYQKFNSNFGIKDEELFDKIDLTRSMIQSEKLKCDKGGYLTLCKEEIQQKSTKDLVDFFNSRYSIRDFSSKKVDDELIRKAVLMAQKSPSVCNRQASKVYVFKDAKDKKDILSYQNGNRGFGDKSSMVLVVTADIAHFVSVGERNQYWIDGGLFSMSLIYALHSLGVGTCCLNWSVDNDVDKKMRGRAEIPDSEAVMMMIAVGHLPDHFRVAQSPRKLLDEVLVFR